MREAPPSVEASVHPAKAEPAALTSKRKRNLGKRLRKKLKLARSTVIRETVKEGKAREAGGGRSPAAAAGVRRPGARSRIPANKKQGDRGPLPASTSTSGRECSGHQEPE